MQRVICNFCLDENGAVTVDWVVLTGAIVGLSIAVIGSISGGAMDHANGLGANLSAKDVSTY
jgi:Flp pilus assembly pilin Flp